ALPDPIAAGTGSRRHAARLASRRQRDRLRRLGLLPRSLRGPGSAVMIRRSLCFALLVGLVAVNAGVAPAGLPGDVEGNCKVDVADAVLLERALAGYVTLNDEQAASANIAPIGGTIDSVVDVGDLVTIKRIVARDAPPATPLAQPAITLVTGTNPVRVQ